MARTELKQYKRLTIPLYKMPESITDIIPINRISEKGIFELEAGNGVKLYDRAYIFEDINFSTKDDEDKSQVLDKFKAILNGLNVSYKMIIVNQPHSVEELNESIYRSACNSVDEPLSMAYQEVISKKLINGRQGFTQAKYFIISCLKYSFEDAVNFFDSIENQLSASFKKIESGIIPLNAAQRLRALHNFYRMGHEKEFTFDWDECLKQKRDWRRDIINTSIKEYDDYISMDYGKRYVSVLFINRYPSGLRDSFVKDITDLNIPMIFTMDIEPVDKEYSERILQNKYVQVQMSIDKQQQQKNKNGAFSSEVSYDKRRQTEELEEYLDGIRLYDEKQFNVDVLIAVSADSEEDLKKKIEQIETVGNGHNVGIDVHIYQQLDALNTVLPTAARFVNTMRPLFTSALSGFVPFNVKEVNDDQGFFYGINQASKLPIMGNRKLLKNGNGNIFGDSGSGKSQSAKFEMGQVMAYTDDDIIIVDPMGEYEDIVKEWRGDYVKFKHESSNQSFLNPMHVPEELSGYDSQKAFVQGKAEFLYAICEQAIKPDIFTNRHMNVVDRATKDVYDEYFAKKEPGKKIDSPTMLDIREKLLEYYEKDNDKISKDMALQLEAITKGSLSIFVNQENVDFSKRLIAFGLDDLGKKMKSLAMLVTMESIKSKIQYNKMRKKPTWVYIDEIHELWKDEYALAMLDELWREVRKKGGLGTGITQHIKDGLQTAETMSIIENSEFTLLLSQGSISAEELIEIFDVSDNEVEYVNNSEPGTGLIRFGKKIVPFDNTYDKNTKLYKMYNTSFHEKVIS